MSRLSVLVGVGLIGGLLTAAVPALAAIDPNGPDLSLSMSESGTLVNAGGALTYVLTVRNTPILQRVCHIGPDGIPQCIYQPVAGGPVNGVVVQDTLPQGSSLLSYTAGPSVDGFTCGVSGAVVTCSGWLPTIGTATITLNTAVPALAPGSANQTLTNSATVNPGQVINERTYANNSATVQATDLAPQLESNLVLSSLTGSSSVSRGGWGTYTATVTNMGQAPIGEVSIDFRSALAGVSVASGYGSPGPVLCTPPDYGNGWMDVWCDIPSNLAPGQSATVTIQLQMPSTFTGIFSIFAEAQSINPPLWSNLSSEVTTYVHP